MWDQYLTPDNMLEEIKSGVLLCKVLEFHQPTLDFTGLNAKARARKPCLNNIELALSALYQKGASPRSKSPLKFAVVPSAEEVYESEKYADKVWLLLRAIFDIFAMHDVIVLVP